MMPRSIQTAPAWVSCALLLASTAACDTKPTGEDSVKQEATKIWESRCVNCHGSSGKGDGPGAATLEPKPRSFADPAWQGRVTDEQITKVIIDGGLGVELSPAMPANPDLASKPDLVAALVLKIRLMQQ